jgi:hypothetical protein
MSDLNCPYCGESNEVCHDDGESYEEDVKHQMECYVCEKSFVFRTVVTFDYYPSKANCLNDNNHEWKPSHTLPKFMTRMICSMCEEERYPTDSEKLEHNIPEYKND